jgi:hypothetical protein
VVGIVLPLNVSIVYIAAADKCWGALALALAIGPAVNMWLVILFCACIPLIRWAVPCASLIPYVIVSIGLPVAAIVVDFLIIWSMPLHGC